VSIAGWARRPIVWAPISVALLALLAWRSRLWETGDRLRIADPPALAIALLLSAAVPILWASRSAGLLAAAGQRVPISGLGPMTAFANTINNLTPASTGELLRIWLLRAHFGVPYSVGAAVVGIERLGAFGYLAGSALVVWVASRAGTPLIAVALVLGGLIVAPAVLYATRVRPSTAVSRLPLGRLLGVDRWRRATSWLRRVDELVAALLTHPAGLLRFAGLTFMVLACYTAQLVLVGRSLGVNLDPIASWGALGLAITAGVLSLLPFGLGSADLVLIGLLGALGVPAPTATAIAFGYRLVSTLPLGLAGVASYAWLSARLPTGGLGEAAAEVAGGLETDELAGASTPPIRR
jgi:uncharacterized protein (TIRG00374 family)